MSLSTPITELDFDTTRAQLKEYLQGQSKFKDYNFDGSNMAVLLDILAYNAMNMNFYTNFAISEMFLDSAELTSSVMSHAKELNYLPRSVVSPMAVVTVTITDTETTDSSILIPAGTRFYTNVKGINYNFYNDKAYIATRTPSTNKFVASCVSIYEGSLVDEYFYATEENDYKFTISNENVDTSSIRVHVDSRSEEYILANTIYGVTATDKVFYLEPSQNGSYNITFGRANFGQKPNSNDRVRVSYRISNGDLTNGANKFATSFSSNVSVTATARASGGAAKESISDIKYFAPKSLQRQGRAVTRTDYETILKERFIEIQDVSAYDGADLVPPQQGKVAISVAVDGGISEALKRSFISFLEDKTPLSIKPIFIEADSMFIDMSINVYVDGKTRTKTDDEYKNEVWNKIKEYNDEKLGKFASVFRTSNLAKRIDSIDDSILSNVITPNPYILYVPELDIGASPSFKFRTELVKPYPFTETSGLSNYKPAVKGSTFTFNNVSSFLQDDGLGKLLILSSDISNVQIIDSDAGTVDYDEGTVSLSNFIVSDYVDSGIKIQVNTVDRDIESPKNRILSIKRDDVTINIIEKK